MQCHFDKYSKEYIPELQMGDLLRMDVRVVSRDGKQDGQHTLAMLGKPQHSVLVVRGRLEAAKTPRMLGRRGND